MRGLERNYRDVLGEMVKFQKNLAQQDGLMQGLIQYFLGMDGGESLFLSSPLALFPLRMESLSGTVGPDTRDSSSALRHRMVLNSWFMQVSWPCCDVSLLHFI